MKRSRINRAIKRMEELAKEHGFKLPPFCSFTPEEWENKNSEYDEIRDNKLGWDITDYGMGNFENMGFSLITIRNGNVNMADKYKKPYAEKLLMLEEGQYSPMHFHYGFITQRPKESTTIQTLKYAWTGANSALPGQAGKA